MKQPAKRKSAKPVRTAKGKLIKSVETFRLEQPLQTALHAKLYRLGYHA